jgi:hypothetical protein
MFTDMFEAIENQREPLETFYDGYVVNTILDAAFLSAESKQWESVKLPIWRGLTNQVKPSVYKEYDAEHWFIKEEVLPNGDKKVILKKKTTGEILEIETISNQ